MVHAIYFFITLLLPFTSWSAEQAPSSVSGVPASPSSPTAVAVPVSLSQALDKVSVEGPTVPLQGNHARYDNEVHNMRSDMLAKFKKGYAENRDAAMEHPVRNDQGALDIPATCAQFSLAMTVVSNALTKEALTAFATKRRASFCALVNHLSPETQKNVREFCTDVLDHRSVFNIEGIGDYRESLETLIKEGEIS